MNNLDRLVDERGDQKIVTDREMEVEENPRLETMMTAYEKWEGSHLLLTFIPAYDLAVGEVSSLQYTIQDITDFCFCLSLYEKQSDISWSGLFLSALVNSGDESNYEIVTEHLDTRIEGLGFQNEKDVTVIGNTGDYTAWFMSAGSLQITGNVAKLSCYHMNGGVMRVDGKIGAIMLWKGGQVYESGILKRGKPDD